MKRSTGTEVADVADVVVEPLQLERDAADQPRPWRHRNPGDLLKRLAKAQAVRNRADAADALGDGESGQRREPLHALFQPAMRVEQTCVEMQHGLADRGKTEMTRFDDTGVNRADRDLEHALAFADEVHKLVGGIDWDAPRSIESLAQREHAPWPAVMDHQRTGIGVPNRDDAKQILHLA